MSTENHHHEDRFVKGLNWGNYEIKENKLSFKSDSKNWFQIPMNSLTNVQQGSNKNEITLEFDKDDENEDGTICEIRLFVPDDIEKNAQKKKDSEKNSNEEEELEEEEKISKTRGEILKEEIMKIANIGSVSGSLAHVPSVQMATPRGKFDLYFTKTALKIHGQSHNYQIQFKNIVKGFMVPKMDGHFYFLILKLKSPLTHGSTSYHFLIFQLKTETEISIELNIPEKDEELIKKLSDLENPLQGKIMDILAKLFDKIVDVRIILPSKNYTFSKGPFIKCSYKVYEGVLYPLEKCLLFAHKPVLYILHEDIKEVDCARLHETGLSQRTFDMTIKTKKEQIQYQFNGIERDEMDSLKNYFEGKKIQLNMVDENNNNVEMSNYISRRRAVVTEEAPALPSEDESDDEDFSASDDYEDDDDEGDEDDEEEEEESKSKKKKKEKSKKEKKE